MVVDMSHWSVQVAQMDQGFHAYVTREPCGVCGLIVPWNYPL